VEGVKVRKTEAGSYLFVSIPQLKISLSDFVKILRLQANVTVTPGMEFGPRFTRHLRINFSQNHHAAFEAIKRTIQIIERYKKEIQFN